MFSTLLFACQSDKPLNAEVFETSKSGNKITKLTDFQIADSVSQIVIDTETKFQTITGFGGSFTEASAYLLNQLSKENRAEIIEAYFGETGAKYSLTRTHTAKTLENNRKY